MSRWLAIAVLAGCGHLPRPGPATSSAPPPAAVAEFRTTRGGAEDVAFAKAIDPLLGES